MGRRQRSTAMARTEQPVDIEHLNRYTGGDGGLNEEILQLFATQCREMMDRLEAVAMGQPDAKSWRETTHTLKGAARGIGAFALGNAAAEAEKAGSERPAVLPALEQLKATSAAVYLFIEQFLKNRR
jgi:HPt (histidine-containing phosphotransfer) domain-containing protein